MMKNYAVSAVVAGALFSLVAGAGPVEGQRSGKASVLDARLKGESVYHSHCMVCHPLAPPPKAAPPVKGVARHYREAFQSRREAVDHMVDFMKKPDESKAICHKEAIRRFGLMPPMNLSDSDLRAVSGWIWDQFDPSLKPGDHRH